MLKKLKLKISDSSDEIGLFRQDRLYPVDATSIIYPDVRSLGRVASWTPEHAEPHAEHPEHLDRAWTRSEPGPEPAEHSGASGCWTGWTPDLWLHFP